VVKLLTLVVHDELRFFAILEHRRGPLFEISNRSLLMVHDLLDLPTIGEERIEPDLPDLQGCAGLFRSRGAAKRIDALRHERIHFRQFFRLLGSPEELFQKKG